MTENITQLLDDASARVDSALETFLQKDDTAVENLHDGLLYSLGLDQEDPAIRGKRIRPALCLVTCECLGGKGDAALPFAMAVELMHNFFLVHDDIQDGDPFRRGRPSAWKRYGIAHSINIGDFLFTKVFDAFLSGSDSTPDLNLQFSLLKLLVETLEYTHIGQAQDMNALRRRDMTLEDYLEIVTNKTGYYLAAPMLGGAQIAGASQATLDALQQLGKFVGPVFQIVDDTIDLTHGKGRDTVGSAIRECSVYVLPSYREGAPRTVLEAMAMGRAVITTDAPGCRQTVEPGQNGLLVEAKNVDSLAEAMRHFIFHPEAVRTMGARSALIARERYDVHRVNDVMLSKLRLA